MTANGLDELLNGRCKVCGHRYCGCSCQPEHEFPGDTPATDVVQYVASTWTNREQASDTITGLRIWAAYRRAQDPSRAVVVCVRPSNADRAFRAWLSQNAANVPAPRNQRTAPNHDPPQPGRTNTVTQPSPDPPMRGARQPADGWTPSAGDAEGPVRVPRRSGGGRLRESTLRRPLSLLAVLSLVDLIEDAGHCSFTMGTHRGGAEVP